MPMALTVETAQNEAATVKFDRSDTHEKND